MAQCPRHRTQLVKVKNGMSLVCPICDYKEYIKAKFWLPEVRSIIDFPTAFSWTDWTLVNVRGEDAVRDETGEFVLVTRLSLNINATSGYAISPQTINLTRESTRYFDCTKVKLIWTHSKQTGRGIKYYASNDGGTGYRIIHKPDVTFNLPAGGEIRQFKQTKYDDLRIKIVLERVSTSDTSPNVTQLIVKYNKTTV